jgi:hypothetical protein
MIEKVITTPASKIPPLQQRTTCSNLLKVDQAKIKPAQGQSNTHKPDQGQLSTCMQFTFFVLFWVPKRIVSGSNYVRDIVLQDMLQHQRNS